MKKNYLKYALGMLFLLVIFQPLTGFAQNLKEKVNQTLNEMYLRPSYWRPYDKTGINLFETTKEEDPIAFEGLRFRIGAGFTQQYQNLKHENKGALNFETSNKLYPLASGFMTAQANMNIDVQLDDGIRLKLETYLSSRHHNETWVKGGYIQFDKLPFKGQFWTNLMKFTTIKMGHMEINYGDAHFRRSDGGQTMYNPFMDNYIMDAFATEIGGEVYMQKNGLFGMVGVTNGMLKGNVDSISKTIQDDNSNRSPSLYTKGGFDSQLTEKIRVRVSGSYYHNSSSAASGLTLYGGDRTGSNYQNVMEKAPSGTALPSGSAIAFSGRLNPGFSKKVDAIMLNSFIKLSGLELFGTYETVKGRTKTEFTDRKANQYAVEGIYRMGAKENVYAGVRYNNVQAKLANTALITYTEDVKVDRFAAVAGWFVTKNILMKGEYVVQQYKNFPAADYRSGGKFNGFVIEAVVGF